MKYGIVLASHTQTGAVPRPGPFARLGDYLCDGGSRPNPGQMHPVVHDGSKFLQVAISPGGNHTAVYFAVDEALKDAKRLNLREIHISLLSKLVWGQITGNAGARRLADRRDLIVQRAGWFDRVHWHLIEPPIQLPQGPINSARILRRLAA